MSSEPIDILIIGFGAVGTIYGYILSQNSNVRVTAIARSAYDVMKKGIRIESEKFGIIENWSPYRLVKDAAEANDRPYHYIIATFKCLPDLMPSASVLEPFLDGQFGKKDGDSLDKGPTIVLIQNGIGIEHPVQMAYPSTPIISVVAWIGANLREGGALVTHGILEKLVFGLYLGEGIGDSDNTFGDPAGYRTPGEEARKAEGWRRTRHFEQMLKGGGGGTELVEDIQPMRYDKTLWNAAWSSICTLSRASVSAVIAPAVLPYTLPVVRRTMLEVIYIARAWGYSEDVLPIKSVDNAIKLTIQNYQIPDYSATPGTPVAKGDGFGGYGFPPDVGDKSIHEARATFKPSMLLDIEAGRPAELEPIIGSLLDRARAKGVDTPRLDLCYAALKVHQDMAVRKYAASNEHVRKWLMRKPAVAGASSTSEWEKAIRRAEREEIFAAKLMGGKQKVTGKPVKTED